MEEQEVAVIWWWVLGCDVDQREYFGGGSATVRLTDPADPQSVLQFTVPGLTEEALSSPFEELDEPYVYLEHIDKRTYSWFVLEHTELEGFEPCGLPFAYAFVWLNYGSYRDLAEATLIFGEDVERVSDLGAAESRGLRTADDWYGGPVLEGDGTQSTVSLPVLVDCPDEPDAPATLEVEWQLDPEVYRKTVDRSWTDLTPPCVGCF
jgi:hypothetical protein